MNKEIWKPIDGYEGLYEVSNFGNIRSVDRIVPFSGSHHSSVSLKGRTIKQHPNRKGYKEVHLCKNGKEKIFKVHRLVAMAFIPNPLGYPQINHKDETPSNNFVENLEWCNGSYNINYGERNKRLSEKVGTAVKQYTIQGEFVQRFPSARIASSVTNISYMTILHAAKAKFNRKSAGGCIWLLEGEEHTLQEKIQEYHMSVYRQHHHKHRKHKEQNMIEA